MLIDWFTVGAQALNFLILVWLMKRFLYKPILHSIDMREKKIASELADADAKRAQAQKDRDEFQHKNEEFDRQRAALLSKATDEAKAERERLLDEARKAADALRSKRSEALQNDAKNLNKALVLRTQLEVFSIARKALADLATTTLEERMGDVFSRRLRGMDGKAKEALGTALKRELEPAVVRSAFDLPAEERAKIQNAINETFSADIHLRFETAPDRISGIELIANGRKAGWSIADYLTSLEKGVDELLKQQDQPAPKAAAKPEPKPDSKPAAPAAAEAKKAPAPPADPAAKPEADVKPPSKSVAQSEPGADPTATAKAVPEAAKPSKSEPKTETKSEPSTKTEAAPPSAPKPETKDAAKTDAAPAAKPEPAEAAPVGS